MKEGKGCRAAGGALPLFLLMSGVYFFAYFQRVAVPGTIFNELQTDFSVSAAAVAALSAIYLYVYGGMQLFAGLMADRAGAGRTLVLGGVVLSAGSLLFPFASSLPPAYLARALVGFGASLIYISLFKATGLLFPAARFPFYLSVAVTIGFAGGLFATLPFERATAFFGWRAALAGAGALCAACVFGAWRATRGSGAPDRPAAPARRGRPVNILRHGQVRLLAASGPVNFAIYFLLQATIGKKMLEDCAGLSSPEAAGVIFVMMLLTQASIMAQGILSRKFSRRRPFIVAASTGSLVAVGLVNLALFLSLPAGWFRAAFYLSALCAVNLMNATAIKEMHAAGDEATAVGSYNGIVYLVVALLSNLAGFVMDLFADRARVTPGAIIYPAEAYRQVFLVCLGLALVAFFAARRFREGPPA